MVDTTIAVVVAILAAGAGAAAGFVLRGMRASQRMKQAEEKAALIIEKAYSQQKDLILEAKDEKLQLQREAEDEARAKRAELSTLESRLLQRDEQLDQRGDMLEQRDRKLIDRERDLDLAREEVARARQEQVVALEAVSGLSAEDAKGILLEAVREEAEHDAVRIARTIERAAREEAQDKARDVIVTAIQRVAADHTAEHTVSVIHLPSDEMKGRIIGREGRNIRALEQATGVDLIIDDTPETVVISGFDPVRRAIAHLAITKLISDGRIHPGRIEEVVGKARSEIDLVIRQAGETAAYEAGVPGLPPEIIKLLGRLKYRTSYGQNVLNHVVETSRLAAVIAAEIGADVQIAKMGGLLHDIGKAVDHEVEGPHAAIGAAIAQRHNLPMRVVNGIAAHHQEVEYACIEAPIVQVADAISASRPGARGEAMDTYVKRLEDLQAIAESFTGVERSFAVQAGREVRILVRPEEIEARSSISSGRTRMRTSRPAWTANERSTPVKLSAMAWRSSSRLTYVSIASPRAPGRLALIASATWTIGASMQAYVTSWWWAAMPFTTRIGRLWRWAMAAPIAAWGPSTSWSTALPMSCRRPPILAIWMSAPSSAAMTAAEAARLDDVVQHVLAVARAVLEPAEELDDLRRQAGHAGFVGGGLAGLADDEVDLGARLVDDLLDAAGVDAAVADELGDRELGDRAADGVEARDDDRLRACRR